jgi:hypothetical protein
MIVRLLLTPFFTGLLILLDIPTFLLLLWARVSLYRSFILAETLFIAALVSLSLYTPTTPPLSARDEQIRETLTYLEQLHQQQPTNRDVLLDLSRMALFLERIEESQLYYQAAFQLDPNHEYFHQDK